MRLGPSGSLLRCDSRSRLSTALTPCDVPPAVADTVATYDELLDVAAGTAGTRGAGADAAFLTSSELLRADLLRDIGGYYNTTAGSGELNVNDNPWGFFSLDLPGRAG
eukprot:327659-Chlamydomonas_euryale.AAC.2